MVVVWWRPLLLKDTDANRIGCDVGEQSRLFRFQRLELPNTSALTPKQIHMSPAKLYYHLVRSSVSLTSFVL